MPTPIELITSKTCPFAQRTAIMLFEKGISFTTTYVNLLEKPEWFLQISPLGKIPLLRINDQVLFESAIINEYLDETHAPQMHPEDPLLRARHRAWIEFSSELIMNSGRMIYAVDEPTFKTERQILLDKLSRLEGELTKTPYFNGETLSLVDVAIAPLFIRLREFLTYDPQPLFNHMPKIRAWSENLLNRHSIQACLPPDYSELFLYVLKIKGKYFFKKSQP
ncbi:MAG TPA: glutathione S-transferase family protein [Gammaproteobacteria bacterium]|nr:glutathione S-transferase family protein [Gammaproteobacteria bacterium]